MRFERRLHPRYPIEQQAKLLLDQHCPGQGTVHVEATNLSLGGVQLACDANTVERLMAQPQRPVKTRLAITLKENIEVDARLIFQRRINQDSYVLGWQFDTFHGEGEALLNQFVQTLASSAGTAC